MMMAASSVRSSMLFSADSDDLEGGDFFQEIGPSSNNGEEPNLNGGDENDTDDSEAEKSMEELLALTGDWPEGIPRFHTVHAFGRCGSEPELKYLDDDMVVLNLSFAVQRKYLPIERKALGVKPGEEETLWYTLELWGRDAEYAAKYVNKGMRLGVTGTLKIDRWENKLTGEPQMRTKIVVEDLDILESRAETELRLENRRRYSGGGNGGSTYPYASKNKSGYGSTANYDDEDEEDEDDDDIFGVRPAGTGEYF